VLTSIIVKCSRVNETKIDAVVEERENLLTNLIDGTLNGLKATKIAPKEICYYTIAPWK